MKRYAYLTPIALVFSAVAVALGALMEGCGEPGDYSDYTCEVPIYDRTDDYGRQDPCCEFKACCPNPLMDHIVIEPGTNGTHMMWDPCCMTEPCPGHNVFLPPDAGVPADTGDAGSDAHASLCDGKCVRANPEGWWGPVLLWYGPPEKEPVCPEQAPLDFYHGSAELNVPPMSCPHCACDPPAGECALPTTMTASSSACMGEGQGVIHTDFSPPPGWNGVCTAKNAIPAGVLCNGAPCVKSLTVDPLTLTESGCTPRAIVPKDGSPPAEWQVAALGCQLNATPACGGKTEVCAPIAEEFSTCIFRDADVEQDCPKAYPEKHVFYDGFDDTRACSECTCDPPSGSHCDAVLSVFKDSTCAVPLPLTIGITAQADSFCYDPAPGSALGSKSISKPVYTPGACTPSGGELTGAVASTGAAVFCCIQS